MIASSWADIKPSLAAFHVSIRLLPPSSSQIDRNDAIVRAAEFSIHHFKRSEPITLMCMPLPVPPAGVIGSKEVWDGFVSPVRTGRNAEAV